MAQLGIGNRIRFGLIGSGWRAEFFVRIAKAIPDVFELTAVLIRDAEKGRIFAEQFGEQGFLDAYGNSWSFNLSAASWSVFMNADPTLLPTHIRFS